MDKIKIKLGPTGIEPTRAHKDDAGLDLYTPISFSIPAHGRVKVDLDIAFDIPSGYYGRLESKSGLMANYGITCRGTIDAGYHGNIQCVAFNHSDKAAFIEHGSKVTQIVFLKCESPELVFVSDFDNETERGDKGFGSTGDKKAADDESKSGYMIYSKSSDGLTYSPVINKVFEEKKSAKFALKRAYKDLVDWLEDSKRENDIHIILNEYDNLDIIDEAFLIWSVKKIDGTDEIVRLLFKIIKH